ncbi:uncharacterized protein AKAME5_001387200 [Lates japonicus]|uniref:Uncharacterized protein n=1 Tax=Lates japonicus TaxID=270547 RepID=A0AAD3MYN6_LATJO|nr:uncharacterized protein AKAME5_001387200 [Lates japonicus]
MIKVNVRGWLRAILGSAPNNPTMQSDRSRQQVPEILEREEMSSTSSTTAELLSPQRAPLNISEANNSSSELDKDSHFHPLSPQPCDVTHSSEGSLIIKLFTRNLFPETSFVYPCLGESPLRAVPGSAPTHTAMQADRSRQEVSQIHERKEMLHIPESFIKNF